MKQRVRREVEEQMRKETLALVQQKKQELQNKELEKIQKQKELEAKVKADQERAR
jgi:hypothetical protein